MRTLARIYGPNGRISDAIRFNPLDDPVMVEVLPAAWNGSHVGVRIADAFNTLSRLPSSSVRSALGFWPRYAYEWQDLLAQLEQAADEQAREHRIANRVRIRPNAVEVSRMERALFWPIQYLMHEPPIARAVNANAFTHAIGRDVEWLARKRGGDPNLWQRQNWAGCALIASGLVRDKVGVF